MRKEYVSMEKLRATLLEWRENASKKALACNTGTLAGNLEKQHCEGRADAYLNVLEHLDQSEPCLN